MNVMDFDALVYKNQGFNTMDKLADSNVVNQMSQQSLQAIQTMQQMPTAQGFVPEHVTLPVFQRQTQQQQQKQANDVQIFISLNGTQKGPFTLEQLKGLVIAEVVDDDTMAWRAGLDNWTTLKTCLSTL